MKIGFKNYKASFFDFGVLKFGCAPFICLLQRGRAIRSYASSAALRRISAAVPHRLSCLGGKIARLQLKTMLWRVADRSSLRVEYFITLFCKSGVATLAG
jgi:hypothetical protein